MRMNQETTVKNEKANSAFARRHYNFEMNLNKTYDFGEKTFFTTAEKVTLHTCAEVLYQFNKLINSTFFKYVMKNKLLSIVVPTYNIEEYIGKCLKSFIKEELLTLIEVIVVNDGSTDNSSNLAKTFSNNYPETFRVIDKENGGHGSTINTALKEANGKFFMVVDGDDWIDADALLNVVKKLKDNMDIDALFFNCVDEFKSNNTKRYHSLSNIFNEGIIDFNRVKLDIDKQVGLLNTIYYIENLRKINLTLDEKTFYVDAEYMLYPLSTVNKAIYINESVYHYLIGRPNQSININNALKHINDRKKVIESVITYFQNLKTKKVNRFALDSYYMKMSGVISDYYNILIMGDSY